MSNKIFPLRIAIITLSLIIIITSSYVTLMRNNILCSGETSSYVKLDLDVIVDVYTLKGGRGIGQEGGAFAPQEKVQFYAIVISGSPIVNETVLFEIRAPNNQTDYSLITFAWTNESGIATISYRIPCPAEPPLITIFGMWNISATVEINGVRTVDIMAFEVGQVVGIISAEAGTLVDETYWAPRTNFTEETYIDFKITLKNIDLTPKNVTLYVSCLDKDGFPFDFQDQSLLLPPKTVKNIFILDLHIAEWAKEGEASAFFNAYDKSYLDGGIPYCPAKEISLTILNKSDDASPPVIKEVIHEPETVQPNQEVTVSANVIDWQTEVQEVILYYRTDTNTTWIGVRMNRTTGDTFKGTICGFPSTTDVSYVIIACNPAGIFAVEDNAGQYYVYAVVSEFPSWPLILSTLTAFAVAAIVWKRKHEKTSTNRVKV
jgi:hypothetical protein